MSNTCNMVEPDELWEMDPCFPSLSKVAEISVHIPGDPRPQLRAGRRAIPSKKKSADGKQKWTVLTFPHEKNKDAESLIRFSFMDTIRNLPGPLPDLPWSGPVRLRLKFWYKPTKTNHYPGKIHMKKPDMSNVLKMLEDALNSIAWIDDCQVIGVLVEKGFREVPGTDMVMELWKDNPPPEKKRRASAKTEENQ